MNQSQSAFNAGVINPGPMRTRTNENQDNEKSGILQFTHLEHQGKWPNIRIVPPKEATPEFSNSLLIWIRPAPTSRTQAHSGRLHCIWMQDGRITALGTQFPPACEVLGMGTFPMPAGNIIPFVTVNHPQIC